jgi:hypothetical protein
MWNLMALLGLVLVPMDTDEASDACGFAESVYNTLVIPSSLLNSGDPVLGLCECHARGMGVGCVNLRI